MKSSPSVSNFAARFALAACAAAALAAPALADRVWGPADGVRLSNGTDTDFQSRVTRLQDGSYFVHWSSYSAGNGIDVSGTRIMPDGSIHAGWAQDRIIAQGSSDQSEAEAVSDGQGGVVVTWRDNNAGVKMRARRLSSSGSPIWGDANGVIIASGATGSSYQGHSRPVVSSGTLMFAYFDGMTPVTTAYVQAVDLATGDKLFTQNNGMGVLVATFTASNGGDVVASFPGQAGGTYGAILALASNLNGAADLNIHAVRVSTSGVIEWAMPLSLAAGDQGRADNGDGLRVAADGFGGAYAVWADSRTAGNQLDLYAARVSSFGEIAPGFIGDGSIVAADPGSQNRFMVAAGTWGVAVAWEDKRNDGRGDIFAQLLAPGGLRQWGSSGMQVNANQPNTLKGRPAIAVNESGTHVLIGWEDSRPIPPVGAADLYVQAINLVTGSPLFSGDYRVVADGAKHLQVEPALAGAGSDWIAVWEDMRNPSNTDVYAQRISTVASAGPTPLGFTFTGNFASGGARIDSNNSQKEIGHRIVVDTTTAGGPYYYVVFHSTNDPSEFSPPLHDAIVKYDAAGVFLASATLIGSNDGGGAAALDRSGNLYVAAKSSPTGVSTLYKFGPGLGVLASRVLSRGEIGNLTDMVSDGLSLFTINDGGDVSNGAKLIKYDANLVPLATATYSIGANHVNGYSIMLQGAFPENVWVLVSSGSVEGPLRMLKYGAAFNGASPVVDVNVSVTGGDHGKEASLAHEAGFNFVALSMVGGSSGVIRRYDLNGAYTGVSANTGAGVNVRRHRASGQLFASWTGYSPSTGEDYQVVKYDGNLAIISSATFASAGPATDFPLDFVVLNGTTAVVTGMAGAPTMPDAQTVSMSLPDNTLPTVAILTPKADYSNTSVLSGTAQALGGNTVNGVEVSVLDIGGFYWDHAAGLFQASTQYFFAADYFVAGSSWAIIGPSLSHGTSYQIEARVRDSAAQSAFTVVATTSDFSPPPAHDITAPGEGAVVNAFPTITGTASGDLLSGVERVNVRIASGPGFTSWWNGAAFSPGFNDFVASGLLNWSFGGVPPTNQLVDGNQYRVSVDVTDKAGNTNTTISKTITFSNSLPSSLSGSFEGAFASTSGVTFNGADPEMGRGVAVDPAGNVYVVGHSSQGPAGDEWIVIKYGPDGTRLADSRLGGANNFLWDRANDAVFAGGYLWVTGEAGQRAVAKYDSNLVIIGTTALSGGGGGGESIASDGASAWIAYNEGDNVAIARVGASLEPMGVTSFPGSIYGPTGSAASSGRNGAIAYSPLNQSVYAVATSTSGPGSKVKIARFSRELSPMGSLELTGEVGRIYKGQGIVADPGTGNLYVTATSTAGPNWDDVRTEVFKFRDDLVLLSTTSIANSNVSDIDLDNAGFVYVGGSMGLFRLDPFNLAPVSCDTSFRDTFFIAAKSSNSVYASGDTSSWPGNVVRLVKRDLSGNSCNPSFSQGGGEHGGLAIALGPSNTLFELSAEAGAIGLGKYDANGVFQSSITLPGTSDDGEWSLAVLGSHVYAVGAASGPTTVGTDLGVWKVDQVTLDLVAAETYNNPTYNLGEFGLAVDTDSVGNLWIAGAVEHQPGVGDQDGKFALALWSWNGTGGLPAPTTMYFGPAGNTIGYAIQVADDGTNEKWLAATTENPGATGPLNVDLLLARYNSGGTGLAAGPFLRPGIAGGSTTDGELALLARPDSVFVAGFQDNEAGNRDLLLLRFGLTGSLLKETTWYSGPVGGSEQASGIAFNEADGKIYVAGRYADESPEASAALYAFSAAGAFDSARKVVGHFSARDLAITSGGRIWLASNESPDPLEFLSGPAAAGFEGLQPVPQPPTSAITFPAHGSITPSILSISGTAADADGINFVQVSIQRQSDSYYWNGSTWAAGVAFVQASGSTNWTLTSPISIHSATGAFVITSRAQDNANTQQGAFVEGFSQVTITRRLNSVTDFRAISHSSKTITYSWNPNGNPAGTQYYIHAATGDCATADFFSPGKFSPDVTGNIAVLADNLSSESFYQAHVHVRDADGRDQSTGAPGAPGSPNISVQTRASFLGDLSNPSFESCGGGTGFSELGGVALGIDGSGNLWEVLRDGQDFQLVQSNAGGGVVSATTLSGATDHGDWDVVFLGGDAFAVGTASSAAQGSDVIVYRVASNGSISATRRYNSTYGNNDYAIAAASASANTFYITGAIQASGPIDEDASGARAYNLVMLKYDTDLNDLSKVGEYSGGSGLDLGLDLTVEPGTGELWVVGFSSVTNPSSSRNLALALWKFSASGSAVIDGPFVRPGFARELDSLNAVMVRGDGARFVASTRLNDNGNQDLAFLKYDLNGSTTAETAWHSNSPAADDRPRGILIDGSGIVNVAGSTGDEMAVWKYAANGSIVSTFTVVGIGPAKAMSAASNGDIWLAVGSTLPYRFSGGTPLSGGSGLQPVPVPPTSGVTSPAHGAVVADLSALAGTAAGTGAGISEVKLSVKRNRDGRYWDPIAGNFVTSEVFFPVAGLDNWTATLAEGVNDISNGTTITTGTYTIASRAQDTGNVLQNAFAVGVSSIVVTRRPNNAASAFLPFVGASSVTIQWSHNANPSNQTYHLHYQTAAHCGDQTNFLSNNYSAGNSQTLTGLQANATYFFTIHVANGGNSNAFLFTTMPNGQNTTFGSITDCGAGSGGGQGSSGGGGFGGLTIAKDASDNLWEVISENGQFRLAKFDPFGVFQSSVALPGGSDHADWRIVFSGSDAFAVGSSSRSSGADLIVYRVSAGVLVASRTYNSPTYDNNDFALGATAGIGSELWITGAIQTSGPSDHDVQGLRTYALGLWRYATDTNALSLELTQSNVGNFDAGFDVAVQGGGTAGNQNLWVVGFSSSSLSPGAAKVDLALWKFNYNGSAVALSAGPFRQPGYIPDEESDFSAKLALGANAIYVASGKQNLNKNTDLAFLKYDMSGALLTEKFWFSNSPAGNDYVRGVALEAPLETLVIAGHAPEQGGDKRLGVWRYSTDGALESAVTMAGQRQARAVALNPNGTWLAGGTTYPILLQSPLPLPGLEGQEGTVNQNVGGATFLGDFNQPGGALYDGGDKDGGNGTSVARDSASGDVYTVAITSRGANRYDWVVIRYNSSGIKLASTTFNSGAGQDDSVQDVLVEGADLYVAGDSPSGQRRVYRLNRESLAVQASAGGLPGTYVGLLRLGNYLYASYSNGPFVVVEKLQWDTLAATGLANGIPGLSGRAYNQVAQKRNLATDGDGIVAVAVSTSTSELVLVKFSTGNLAQQGSVAVRADRAYRYGASIAYYSGSAHYFVTAVSTGSGADVTHVFKYDTGLAYVTETPTPFQTGYVPAGMATAVRAIAVDQPSGKVFVVGNNNQLGVAYDSDLIQLGVAGNISGMSGIVIDNPANIYVAGSLNGLDVVTRRVNFNIVSNEVGIGYTGLTFYPGSGILWASSPKGNAARKFVSYANPVTDVTVPASSRTILSNPLGLAFDTGRNLWVSRSTQPGRFENAELVRFSNNGSDVAAAPSLTLSAGLWDISGAAFQPDTGDLWVSNAQGAENVPGAGGIVKFFRGGSLGSPTFSNLSMSTFTRLATQGSANGLAFDRANNLWAASNVAGTITMYPNSAGVISSTPAVVLSLTKAHGIVFDSSGTLFASSVDVDGTEAPGSGKLYRFRNFGTPTAPALDSTPALVQTGVDLTALAFDPVGQLWGADFNASQVLQLSTAVLTAQQEFAAIRGTLSYGGSRPGNFQVLITTNPVDPGQSSYYTNLGASPGEYFIGSLPVPNTYYVFAFRSAGIEPNGFDPLGVYITEPAPQPPAPIYITAASTRTADVQLLDLSAATGTITNLSSQIGNLRAQAWYGDPRSAGSALIQDEFVSPYPAPQSSSYAVYVQTTTLLFTRAYIDANFNQQSDPGEDNGVSVGPLATVAGSSIPVNIAISSSAAGSVYAQTTNLAPETAGSNVTDLPMLRLGLWSSGGSAQMNRLRVSMKGDAPSSYVHVRAWKDANGDGLLQTGLDYVLEGRNFDAGAPPVADLPFFSTQTINATTQYFFLTVTYFNVSAGRRIGVFIDRPQDLGLVSGSPTATFPLASTEANIRYTLHAKPADGFYPTPMAGSYPSGGAYTGLFVNSGQRVSISGQGNWSPGALTVGPDGTAQTGGLSPSLRIGSLVGRVGGGQWFQIGVSTTFVAAQGGDLYLAMNDTNYEDNAGLISVDFGIIVSTVAKTWAGNSGINLNASLDQNWLGGAKPAPGEPITFDGAISTRNCNWDLAYFEVGRFTMNAAYTGMVTIGDPGPGQFYNQIRFSSHVSVAGGTLNMGDNSDATVEGQLRVEGGTFDLGSRYNFLRLSRQGVVVRSNGHFKSAGSDYVSLQALNSFDAFPFIVENGTVTFANPNGTEFSNTSGVDLAAAANVPAFERVRFFNFNYNAAPSLVVRGAVNRKFKGLEFDMFVSTNVDASNASGATIAMLDAFGPRMGTPYERDPHRVVAWSPDGGGSASISGTLSTDGSGAGNFVIVASTQSAPPAPWEFCAAAGTSGATCVRLSTAAAGVYGVSGLLAPNTWYVFAYRSTSESYVESFAPRGGYGNPGLLRSDPVFLDNGSAPANVNVSISSWGAVQGQVNNFSNQQASNILITLTQAGDTTTFRTPERLFFGPQGGFYYLAAPAGASQVFAWVDVNNNGVADAFEASGTAATGAVEPGQTGTVNVNIAGGSAVAGASLTVRSSVIHPGFVGEFGNYPIFKLVATASGGGDVTWSSLRLDRVAAPYQLRAGVWKDQGTLGTFDDGGMGGNTVAGPGEMDMQVGDTWISAQASSGTVAFWQPQTLSSGQSATYYVTVEVQDQFFGQGRSPQRAPVQLSFGTSLYFNLTQGAMADQAITPNDSGAANVYFTLQAFSQAEQPSGGGYDTGVFIDAGQKMVLNIATGTWTPVPEAATTPAGISGTEGRATVVPSARIGALLARVGGSPWVAVGTQATITAEFGGSVGFAMNDLNRDYFNNTGKIHFDFSVTGSTAGALAGRVNYAGGEAGPNSIVVQLHERYPNCFGQFCTGPVINTANVTLTGATYYFYTFPALRPFEYSIDAYVSSRQDQKGGFGEPVRVVVGATVTAPTFGLSLGTASVSGTITYAGVQQYGQFFIAAATTSNLEHEVVFFGNAEQPTAGPYTLANLPIPNTYYIVGFRDVNYNHEPDGPEPFGLVGVSTGPLSQLAVSFTPVYVDGNKTGINITMVDRGAISGQLKFQTAVSSTTEIVVEAGLGLRGSPGYTPESRDVKRLFVPKAAGETEFFQASLLRPATGYSVFAFLDANRNGSHDANELFGAASNLAVPSGGYANIDLTIAGAQPPPAVTGFKGTVTSSTQLDWTWDAVPGATSYELRSLANAAVATSAGTSHSETLTPNTSSQIDRIVAINAQGAGPFARAPALPIYTLADAPASPDFAALVTENVAQLSWGFGSNPAGTRYEVQRATSATAPYFAVLLSSVSPATDATLVPNSTYFYRIAAVNQIGVLSGFTGPISTVTPSALTPSISGLLSYGGLQSGNIRLQAFSTSTFAGTAAVQLVLPAAPSQSYFLSLAGNTTYWLRAFVDCGAVNRSCAAPLNGLLEAGEDRGTLNTIYVAAGPVTGRDFSITRDLVLPGAPSSLLLTRSIGRVNLAWAAPTTNANGTALGDLAGFRVQRSTQTTGFFDIGLTTTTGFSDLAPVAGFANYYRVVAVDLGLNASAPSGVQSVTPLTGGTISGSVSTNTTTGAGAYRIRLATVSAA
ncbi:MAG: hypothetical protein HY554_01105, partial [Elusimicrobia bacterium]|nr:hypothetical protein [Elusimicrobiota bacterium]